VAQGDVANAGDELARPEAGSRERWKKEPLHPRRITTPQRVVRWEASLSRRDAGLSEP
jgi:hypothetical protein